MTLAVSGKGWVVIPAKLRRKYRLGLGTAVQIVGYSGVFPRSRLDGRVFRVCISPISG